MDELQKAISGLHRVGVTHHINTAQLSKMPLGEIVKAAMEQNAYAVMNRIIEENTTVDEVVVGQHVVQTVAYVLSESELRHLIAVARESGRVDSMRWAV